MYALRDGPLDHHQIAADMCRSPWLIRETLLGLRRDQLVVDELGPRSVAWKLTHRGWSEVWGHDQLALTEAHS
jgi:hypothetical protein